LAQAEADGVKFAEAKGAHSLADLRAMTWQKLIEPVPAAGGSDGPGAGFRFSPIIDGYLQPMAIRQTIQRGMQNDVPTLTGANLGELGGLGPAAPVTAESFRAQAQKRYGEMANEFLKLYPAESDEQARASQAASARDQSLVSMYLWARERGKTAKTPAYLYLWDHTLPGPDAARFGAFHTSEVPYVLNTLYMSDRPFSDADWKIADKLSSYWANFAKNGDPNGGSLPEWAPAGTAHEIMELGDKLAPIPVADADRFAFFEKFLSR
jgi:carboxylesterase type B